VHSQAAQPVGAQLQMLHRPQTQPHTPRRPTNVQRATPGPGAYEHVRMGRDSVGRHGRGGPRYSFGTSGRFGDTQFISKAHTTNGAANRAPGPKYDTRDGIGIGARARWEPNAFSFGKPQGLAGHNKRSSATPGPGRYHPRGGRSIEKNAAPAYSFGAPVPAPGTLQSKHERRPAASGGWVAPPSPSSKKGSWSRADRDAGSMFKRADRPASAPARRHQRIDIPSTEAKATPRLGQGSGSPAFSMRLPEPDMVKQHSRFLSKDHCRSQVGHESPPATIVHEDGKMLVSRSPEFTFGTAPRVTAV
jgi:hypothetical protein